MALKNLAEKTVGNEPIIVILPDPGMYSIGLYICTCRK